MLAGLRHPLTPLRDMIDGELVLSASEIASYEFCFVPMSAGPSRAILEELMGGAL